MSRLAPRSHAAAPDASPVRPLSPHEDGAHHDDSIEAAHAINTTGGSGAADDDDVGAAGAHQSEPEDEGEETAQNPEHYRVYQPSETVSAPPAAASVTASASPPALQTPFGKQRPHATLSASPGPEGPEDWPSGMATVPSTPPFRGGTAAATKNGVVAGPLKLHQAGLAAMKKNLIPGLLLQCIALLIILVYYLSDSARANFEALGDFKTRTGYGFSFFSTAIFGGLLPWLIVQLKKEVMRRRAVQAEILAATLQRNNATKSATDLEAGNGGAQHAFAVGTNGRDVPLEPLHLDTATAAAAALAARSAKSPVNADGSVTLTPVTLHPLAELAFMMIFWGLKGVEVDAFYRFQGYLWGTEAKASVIIPKVLFDQFVYNPPWATPSVLIAFYWRDSGFSLTRTWARLTSKSFWTWAVPECLIGMWCVWIPACSLIYILPGALQVPLFNIVLCFWSLCLTLLTTQ